MPYGFTSPFAGTVEAILLTVFRFARKGVALALEVVAAALAAADVLGVLLVLAELPQPATASATPTRARIDVLGTGVSPVDSGIGRDGFPDQRPRPAWNLAIPRRHRGNDQTHGPPFARFLHELHDSSDSGFLPGAPSDLIRAGGCSSPCGRARLDGQRAPAHRRLLR